jgi:hypothetical protein
MNGKYEKKNVNSLLYFYPILSLAITFEEVCSVWYCSSYCGCDLKKKMFYKKYF